MHLQMLELVGVGGGGSPAAVGTGEPSGSPCRRVCVHTRVCKSGFIGLTAGRKEAAPFRLFVQVKVLIAFFNLSRRGIFGLHILFPGPD